MAMQSTLAITSSRLGRHVVPWFENGDLPIDARVGWKYQNVARKIFQLPSWSRADTML